MKVRLLTIAEKELDGAIDYYNYQLLLLGNQFFKEINRGIDRIIMYPDAWTKVGKNVRRYLLKHFPYAIYYVHDGDEIIIVSIAHLHQKPEIFENRIN